MQINVADVLQKIDHARMAIAQPSWVWPEHVVKPLQHLVAWERACETVGANLPWDRWVEALASSDLSLTVVEEALLALKGLHTPRFNRVQNVLLDSRAQEVHNKVMQHVLQQSVSPGRSNPVRKM